MYSARLQSPCQSFAPALLSLLSCLAQPGHRPARNAAAVNPVLHSARLRPCGEVKYAEAGIVPPSGERHEFTGRRDALAHGLNLALALGTERIVTPDLG